MLIDYKKAIASKVHDYIPDVSIAELEIAVEIPPKPEMGDYALPCFKLARILRKSPKDIAEHLSQEIKFGELFARVQSLGPYLNFFVDRKQFLRATLEEVLRAKESYGRSSTGCGNTVLIDYSSPNIAKPFHVGHLRSTIIGNALYNIYSFLGFKCIGVNHLGDWGTQFGKQLLAYKLWGDKEMVERDPINELVRLYVHFHEEAEKHPELNDHARMWFKKLEEGDEEALHLWRWFSKLSLQEFKKIYKRLNVDFDYYTGESFYLDKVHRVIDILKEKNLLEESEGAFVVDLNEFDMPPCLIIKRDGTTIYPSRDLAAAIYRRETFAFTKALYLTDYSQNLHFKQWFKTIELMGFDWYEDLEHVPFGRVRLAEGRMQTRKGNVVLLEDVINQTVDKSLDIIEERNPNLPNKEEVAEQVGIGAIIFSDLYHNRKNDIVFDWNEILNFDGETGPYVQYTYARSCRVLEKATVELTQQADYSILDNSVAHAVVKNIYDFPTMVKRAAEEKEPSLITRHMVSLAQKFNRFYHEFQIVVDDESIQQTRLLLCLATNRVLKTGLQILGIPTPERM